MDCNNTQSLRNWMLIFREIQLIALHKYNFKSFQKNFKNSNLYPSLPGDLLFFVMFLSTSKTSFSPISVSNFSDSSLYNFGSLCYLKYISNQCQGARNLYLYITVRKNVDMIHYLFLVTKFASFNSTPLIVLFIKVLASKLQKYFVDFSPLSSHVALDLTSYLSLRYQD